MSFDRARRRFAAATLDDLSGGGERTKLWRAPTAMSPVLRGCLEACSWTAALIGGTIGLVRALDLLLDKLHDWLC